MSHGHPESDSTLLEGPDPAADFPGRGSKTPKKGRIDGHHLQTPPHQPPAGRSPGTRGGQSSSPFLHFSPSQPFPAETGASPHGFGRNRLHIQLPSEVGVPKARTLSPGGQPLSPTHSNDTQARGSRHSSGLGLAPRNTLSLSSRNSWKDTTALRCGSSWGHRGRKGVGKQSHHRPALREPQQHLRCPSCQGHPCPAAPDPAGCSADGQTDTQQPLPRESQRGGVSQPKNRQGKKNRREKPQEKPHSALPRALTQSSRQPRGMENALPAPTLPVLGRMKALVAKVPLPTARPRASGHRALAHLLGCCPDILFPKY